MAQIQHQTRSSTRGLFLALTIGFAGLVTGCAQSEAMHWAQTAPTIAPEGVRLPVSLGVTTDEPVNPALSTRDSER